MTVKVVDPNPSPEVIKYCVCKNCGVKLSYVPRDEIKDYSTDYTGDRDFYYYIPCAACNAKVMTRRA